MEYCCHVWAGVPSCYLELLDKLQKRMCQTVGPSLAASLEPLNHHRNVASLSLFCRYYFVRLCMWNTRYSDRLHDFWFVLVHDTQSKYSQSNNAQFMQRLSKQASFI